MPQTFEMSILYSEMNILKQLNRVMRLDRIPKKLHQIINLVIKWGINDDGYRDEQIENSNTEDLMAFVNSIDNETLVEINNWLSNEEEMKKSTAEYINYTCFIMAFEYAKAVIKSR